MTFASLTARPILARQSRRLHQLAIYRLLEDTSFEPEVVKAMTAAYHTSLKTLRVTDGNSPMAELLAKNIVDVARRGERDPIRLHEKALGSSIDY